MNPLVMVAGHDVFASSGATMLETMGTVDCGDETLGLARWDVLGIVDPI